MVNAFNLTVPLMLIAQLVSPYWELLNVLSVLLPLKEFWFFLNKSVSAKMDSMIIMEFVPLVDQDVLSALMLLPVLNVLLLQTPTTMVLANALMDSSSPSALSDIARDVLTILLPAAVSLKLLLAKLTLLSLMESALALPEITSTTLDSVNLVLQDVSLAILQQVVKLVNNPFSSKPVLA